jgi:hypothetical protein
MNLSPQAGLYSGKTGKGDLSLPDSQGPSATPSAGPPPAPRSIVLVISGPVARDEMVGLCERIRGMLERSEADLMICWAPLDDPDAATVDLVARLAHGAAALIVPRNFSSAARESSGTRARKSSTSRELFASPPFAPM